MASAWALSSEAWTALGTWGLVLATSGLWLFTGLLWRATIGAVRGGDRALATTREIGEAQVRAYVSVKSAVMLFGGDGAIPFIGIEAVNSGQSPARGFTWTPTVRYFTEGQHTPKASPEDDEWDEAPGVDLAVGAETSESQLFVITDTDLADYLEDCGPSHGRVTVAVRVQYTYLDVFGVRHTEAAFYAGIAERGSGEANKQRIHPLNTSDWSCHLNRIGRTHIWDDDFVWGGDDNELADVETA